jgi:hypothetical protein
MATIHTIDIAKHHSPVITDPVLNTTTYNYPPDIKQSFALLTTMLSHISSTSGIDQGYFSKITEQMN